MIGRYTVSDLHNDITRVGHHVTENDSDISKASSRFRPEGRNRGLPIGWIRLNNRKQEAASIKATSMDNNATQGKGTSLESSCVQLQSMSQPNGSCIQHQMSDRSRHHYSPLVPGCPLDIMRLLVAVVDGRPILCSEIIETLAQSPLTDSITSKVPQTSNTDGHSQ